ncbi:hypothetical protein AJ87_05675 [Rhizobium yanglingense]|nr:hypothetical protein AJ87_05675 [Rhizobium yanglingense]
MTETKEVQSSPARGGAGMSARARKGLGSSAIWSSARWAVEGPTPGRICISRKPATRSRGLSAKRRTASMSLTCALSRNFRPPNFRRECCGG